MNRPIFEAGEAGILQQRFAYVGATSNVEYVGKAQCGVEEGDLEWQIIKLTYTGSNVTAVNFANDDPNFSFSWTAKSTYFV